MKDRSVVATRASCPSRWYTSLKAGLISTASCRTMIARLVSAGYVELAIENLKVNDPYRIVIRLSDKGAKALT